MAKRHETEQHVDEALVRRLVDDQFPQWAHLPLTPVADQGTDHTLFRLGDDMVVRVPIMEWATRQAAKEARWLPFLAPQLPLDLPTPIALGQPQDDYPWSWSVVRWIDGERAVSGNFDTKRAAHHLAAFVRALHDVDATDGPRAGKDTGYRGKSIRPGAQYTRDVIAQLDDQIDTARAFELWESAVAADEWDGPPTWFHGDLAGNLIVRDERLVAVIDSGYGVGDPACDLSAGWMLLAGDDRATFLREVGLDEATQRRALGWALGPPLNGLLYYKDVPQLHARMLESVTNTLSD